MDNQATATSQEGKCNAKGRTGKPCKRPAGHGTAHVGYGACRLHAGGTPNAMISAQRKMAVEAVGMFALRRDVDPRTALLEEVHRAAGAIVWLEGKVNELDAQALIWGVTEERDSTGHMGDSVTSSATYSKWYEMLGDERKRLVDASKACIAAGLMEREVQIAEKQGLMIAAVVRGILGKLNLTPEQEALVGVVVPQELRMINGPVNV